MASMKRGAMVASMLVLFSIIASACNQPYSTPPSVTSTPINSNSLFQTPLGQATNMTDVQNLATASALALSGNSSSRRCNCDPERSRCCRICHPHHHDLITHQCRNHTNSDPGTICRHHKFARLHKSARFHQSACRNIGTGSTSSHLYTSSREFVYCIARRFNVDPDQTLAINGLSDAQTIYPGLVLKIPSPELPWRPYAAKSSDHIYCCFLQRNIFSIVQIWRRGLLPSIAAANGLSTSAALDRRAAIEYSLIPFSHIVKPRHMMASAFVL